jgi:hypothetical protein
MTPLYSSWSRRGAVEDVIYSLEGKPFTTKDLKHAIDISGKRLLTSMDQDDLRLAIRDAIRGLREAGRVEVQKTASRGGGYVYTCAVQLDVTDEEDALPVVSHTLTKREQFAMAAMQGLCSRSGSYHTPQDLAHDAVEMADTLLAALERVANETINPYIKKELRAIIDNKENT